MDTVANSNTLELRGPVAMEPIPLASKTNYLSWFEANPNRFMAERAAVQQSFGQRYRFSKDRSGSLFLKGLVKQSGKELPIRIEFPVTYPNTPPKIYSERALRSTPHQLGSGELCWINYYSSDCVWNPGKHNVTLAINAAQRWFACYLVYLARGEWPVGADH